MLHIHNGDLSANTSKRAAIPGEHFAWREALIAGPTPSGVEGAEWRQMRAQHLSEAYGVDRSECQTRLRQQEEVLSNLSDHEEVALWFESDLFCQTNLLYLLHWFSERQLGNTKLSLVCIGEYPGVENFRGLGQLNPKQMASLFPTREEVSAAQMRLAAAAWQAYRSPDPTAIETLLESDTAALPFLRDALQHHLQRFPSVRNGLGRIENRGLELIHGGLNKFVDLFGKFRDAEPVYGLGDFQFWLAMKQISEAGEPLLAMKNGDDANKELSSKEIAKTSFVITRIGQAVLQGRVNFVEINGIDLWLGGVHLSGNNNLWRWDDKNQKILAG
jgi:hypothetical protein